MQSDARGATDLQSGAAAMFLALLLLGSLASGAAVAGAASGSSTADPAAAAPAPTAPSTSAEASSLAQAVDTDRTRIRIALQPNGDGEWSVEFWTRLEDEADEEAFEELQADVESDPANYTAGFRDRMAGSVDSASAATGREMAMENVSVATRTEGVPSSYGVLAYEFAWTNFAAVDGDRLRAGAAIDGFLLEPNTRLTIAWPAAYRATTVSPTPDDRTDTAAVWRGGETDFIAGEPRVVATSAPPADDSLLRTAGILAVVLLVLFVLAWLVHSGRLRRPAALGGETEKSSAGDDGDRSPATGSDAGSSGSATAGGVADAASGADGEAAADGEPTADGETAPHAEDADATAGADQATTAGASADDGSQPSEGSTGDDTVPEELPSELLSNEEQVLRLLEAEGGRLKQQQVVAELEWTDAKTSQVVTSMREDDQIEVFRIGRENVLALPGEMDL